MKLQPTCAICLSKIKLIEFRSGSRRRTLLCKHVFHTSCIEGIFRPQCPLCEHPIFNDDEVALLACKNEDEAIAILKTLHERNINVKNLFLFLTKEKKTYKWIVELMYKYCDFTELLVDNLNDKILVQEIVAKCKVNWFKTFYGGLTFFDLVYERTTDPEIIALVHEKLPISPPMITKDVSIPNRKPFQRHQRSDSTTATIRRSLRISRPSMLPTHHEEDLETYPIYQNLYPSAPPLEMI